jgi:hypothetical protein
VEEHVPILAPETLEDKKGVFDAVCRSRGIKLVESGGGVPDDATLATLFEALGFVTPAALELIANRARRTARRAGVPVDASTSVIHVPFTTFLEEAASFVPEGSKSKLQLQTIGAVMYTNHLAYLPEPWKSRLRDDPDGLSREREQLRVVVGYQ